jgi:hypothetical protein
VAGIAIASLAIKVEMEVSSRFVETHDKTISFIFA